MSSQQSDKPSKDSHHSGIKVFMEDKTAPTAPAAPSSTATKPAAKPAAKTAAGPKPKQPIRLKPNNPIAKIKRPLSVKGGTTGAAVDGSKSSKYLEELERYRSQSCASEHSDRPLVK